MEASARARATALLEGSDPGSQGELNHLLPLVYDELRALAHRQLVGEQAGHTLNTTALVHEAYFRLVDDTRVTRRGRSYFFGAAARAMRQVLVDHARRRLAEKRGGDVERVTLDEDRLGAAAGRVDVDRLAEELIDLDRALSDLAQMNPRHARVVECRFFGGMEVEETAEALGVSPRTVKYDWALARAWLRGALAGGSPDDRDASSGASGSTSR